MQQLIENLHRAHPFGFRAELTDSELLERFVSGMDQRAFEYLVRRHVSMVLGVCRRVLRDEHLAEDAFQATFLTLAEKASTIARSESVASWLYKVAFRIALRARRKADRGNRSQSLVEDVVASTDNAVEQRDLHEVLDEEINRLPEKHRVPIVLCYVEGKTHAEAAREMACPKGTVLSRLARARDTLRGRLTGRGITLSVAAFASGLAPSSAVAVPRSLIQATLAAAQSGSIGENVKCLMGGIGMSSGLKTKIAVALLILASLTLVGVVHSLGRVEAKLAPVPVRKAVTLEPGPGLIGRTKANGESTDLVFLYQHGKVFHPKLLFPKYGKPPRKVSLEITFEGVLDLQEEQTVVLSHSGGSSSRGHAKLLLDGKQLGPKIGDDFSKNAKYELKLSKGSHRLEWVLTGGYFGCALLKVQDKKTNRLMPLRFTDNDMKGLKDVPLKRVVQIESDERGWPIPSGW